MGTIPFVWNQNLTGNGKEFTKVSRAVAEAKSYLYERFIRIWQVWRRIIMESSNSYTSIDQRQVELQNELRVEWKKGHQPYYCNLDWMESGGQIPWSAIAICEMSKTWQTGNLEMNEDLENHLKDRFFHLTQGLDISQPPRETNQEFINLERKYDQESF